MNNVASTIFVVLAIITIIAFILTRYVDIEIIKRDSLSLNFNFTFIKLCFIRHEKTTVYAPMNSDVTESEINPKLEDILSLFSTVIRHIKKCKITLKNIQIPIKKTYPYFLISTIISTIIAYVDSNVEKLNINYNAFTLSSDEPFEIDIQFRATLFNLLSLAAGFLINLIKIGKKEKSNVRN